MQRIRVQWIVTLFLGVLSATQDSDIGSPQWFDRMRTADGNVAMLKALAGSNGQPVVPPDCAEISAIISGGRPNTFRGKMPSLRIVSTDDRVDNVPRSPFIHQDNGATPNFYAVLKRGLTYDFYWLTRDGDESRFASWTVPANAPRQLRVSLALDARGNAKITMAK
jgi:hypothetical protein